MKQKYFIITELRILSDCDIRYRKVLKGETFKFNQLDLTKPGEKDLIEMQIFEKRVFIQTIVGKNGSGKSSLLEVMYRIINNYSYYIIKYTKPKRVAAEPIYLIEDLYADLDFIIDGEKCCILIRNKSLGLIQGEKKMYFGPSHKDFKTFKNYNHEKREDIINLASSFFYTIVTNYSFQSLINRDFANDVARDFVGLESEDISSGGNWLNSLFRKNDGYITPIVLNPYREDGTIDLNNEYYLTLSRISALLIQSHKSKKALLSGYRLATIRYTANHDHFIYKLFPKYNKNDDAIHLSELKNILSKETSLAHHIIRAYGLNEPNINNEIDVVPYAYLVYKTLSVLGKYSQYAEFKNIPAIHDFNRDIDSVGGETLNKAIDNIRTDKSHVNNKIFQTLNYIQSYQSLEAKFSIKEYVPYASHGKFQDIDDIIKHLPPPFFEQEISLYKGEKDTIKGEEDTVEIPFSTLSSGERQFIYTISTIVYHLKNLLSIQQVNRIRYRNINIVLDEVEICFHPEFQRKFIYWLLDLIKRLNLNRHCSINIMIVTHSPFILSDMPKNNILYLEEGKQFDDAQLVNPFAANINDILYQSFFLEGGFIGEHAKVRINSALTAMIRKSNNLQIAKSSLWNEDTLQQLIYLVGEPLLRDNLLELYAQAFMKSSYEDIIESKDKEIQQLKDRVNKLSNKK